MGITYSAHEAKARFAEVLCHVRQGETVTVSYRGEPVAEVRPLPERGAPEPQENTADGSETVVAELVRELELRDPGRTQEERLEDMRRRGVLIPSSQPDRPLKPVARIPGALARFLAERHYRSPLPGLAGFLDERHYTSPLTGEEEEEQ